MGLTVARSIPDPIMLEGALRSGGTLGAGTDDVPVD